MATKSGSGQQLAGVVGFYEDAPSLIEAMKKVRASNFEKYDAFTPYPVHGLDAAQGLRRSWIPYVTLVAGITGTTCAFLLQYWTSAVDWPLIVGGKPFNSWPAFVPIMFELTILFAGLSTVAAMFIANGLPNLFRRSFDPSITRDRFAIMIEESAGGFDEAQASQFLKQAGAKDVRSVYCGGWF